MRAGLSMIQQTLTPEAAGVLNRSIAEAARRGHSQTTPLHVAATLLASPSGYLRQACIRSHPMSSHPLQCRALELCFSVALDRLPSAAPSDTNAAAAKEPPISNALMAALKRAQAHQRRGCPEQQQQPLLAVKVELEQLVVSILDDPSVSRVMREASFSSPAVKATIEKSLASTSSSSTSAISSSPPTSTNANATAGNSPSLAALGLRPAATTVLPANRNLYLNPRLQQTQYLQQQQQVASKGGGSPPNGEEDVRKVLEILTRAKKRNPVLVGDSNPEALMREVLQKLEKNQVTDRALRNLHVISFDRELPSDLSLILLKMKDLQNSIETHLCQCRRDGGGVVVNLGDLKWLVEAAAAPRSTQIQQQQLVSTVGQAVVAEMGKLLGMLREREGDADGGGGGRVWLIGAATCSTYLRCMVYHQTIENDWDLQAVPIAPKAPPHAGVIARTGSNGILSSPMESLASPGGSAALLSRPPMLEDRDPSRRTICPACTKNYELESAKLAKIESNNSSCNSETDGQQSLPRWLQAAKLHKESTNAASDQIQTGGQDLKLKQNKEELLKKWTETCSRLHPNFHHPTAATYRPPLSHDHPISGPQRLNPMLLRPLQPKPVLAPTLNHRAPVLPLAQRPTSPPRSPVGTDLALGQQNSKPRPSSLPLDQNHQDRVKESQGCTLDFFSDQQKGKFGSNLDADSFKRLFKGLTNEVGWQQDAASAVAAAVTQCRSGNGKRRAAGTNSWLLFMGPDKVGKKRMAAALSELLFGTTPVIVSLSSGSPTADGEDGESNTRFRGKTALDRLAEAVRRNPFSVFVLEDVDRSDMLVQGSIKRVMERGRLLDSHGREFSLGSGVYIIAANAVPESLRTSVMDSVIQCEEKIEAAANSRWQLEIMVGEKAGKRRAGEWMFDKDVRSTKARKERQMGLSLDLNLGLGAAEDETGEGSPNSSDLTTEHSHDYGRLAISRPSSWLLPADLIDAVDEAVLFRPVDFGALRRKVSDLLIGKFNSVIGSGMGSRLQVEEEALDRIVGGIWFGDSASTGFEEWMESVLGGSFQQLRRSWAAGDGSIIRLVAIKDGQAPSTERLPSRISIAGEGLF